MSTNEAKNSNLHFEKDESLFGYNENNAYIRIDKKQIIIVSQFKPIWI